MRYLLPTIMFMIMGRGRNHVYDYGERAFLDTLSALENNGIKYTGGGKDSKEAKKPVYFQSKGKTIAVIAATRAEKYILTPAAGKHSPGVFRTYDDTQYVRAIRKAKKKADVVIAFVHWGTEYSTKLESADKPGEGLYQCRGGRSGRCSYSLSAGSGLL